MLRLRLVLSCLSAAVLLAFLVPAAQAATPAHTDVMFLFDTSGSMSTALGEGTEEIQEAMAQISAALPDVQYGLTEVRDYGGSSYDAENPVDLPWHLDVPITSNTVMVQEALAGLTAVGGGDEPEAYGRALWETDTNPTVGWRGGARHLIVLIADEVPHDDNLNEGIAESVWVAPSPWDTGEELPGTWSIPGTQWALGDNMDFQATLQQLANDGKPLEFVDFHGESGYLPYWENWAGRTGGEAEAASTGELVKELVSVAEAGAGASLPPCPAGQVRNAEEQCVVAAVPVVPPPAPVPAPQPSIYVALGDSYSSGEGVPPFETGSNTRRDKCHRSSRAYAELLKGTRAFPATLKFAACSGARIANFYPGKGQYGEKGQLADLSAQDSVVSLTAGGNDVLFGKFIESCVLLPACYLTDDLPVRALIKHTIKRLPKLYREVLRRAPKAQAYVLGYPHLFSPRPSLLCNGIDRLEAAWITRMEDLLNGGIRSAVDKLHESRLHFVDTADAFAGGELCSKKKPVYLNGIIKAHLEYSFHPTAAGQRRLAEVLAKAVRKG